MTPTEARLIREMAADRPAQAFSEDEKAISEAMAGERLIRMLKTRVGSRLSASISSE